MVYHKSIINIEYKNNFLVLLELNNAIYMEKAILKIVRSYLLLKRRLFTIRVLWKGSFQIGPHF